MADEHKGIAMVILGIVAVIAIVGLVLLFVGGKKATGEGVYGGAIKQVSYPYWQGRGVPMGGREDEFRDMNYRQARTHWNFYGQPKRAPYDLGDQQIGDVPSTITGCGPMGFRVGYSSSNRIGYYETQGATCIDTDGSKAGVCCYWPQGMEDGIAGKFSGRDWGRTPYGYG